MTDATHPQPEGTMTKLMTGHEAIDHAETHDLRLRKYADPTEGARDDLTPDEAREVAAEDPSLIYLELASTPGWGPWHGHRAVPSSMTDEETSYDYPISGAYNETMATLADGRVLTVNTQYSVVTARGHHADGCDQINKIGGRCTCGLLDGIDVAALVADARARGLFGRPPKVEPTDAQRAENDKEIEEYERSTRAIYRAMDAREDR